MSEFEKYSAERKKLQAEGEVPEWYTTQGYLMFIRKCAHNGETIRGAFDRIARTMAKHYTADAELAYDKFFRLLWNGWLSTSTPVMSNSGTGKGMVVSCSGGYIEDSVHGFYKTHSENAMLSKLGYGTSSYLGDIRPRGSQMGDGGLASGMVPVFDTAIDVMTKISQGSSRRGAWAGYLPVDHGDFWEMAGYAQKNPADTNIGWMYSDEEIERLKAGDKDAIQRFNKVLYGRCRMGKGYMWKNDLANRLAPDAIKNSGVSIKASNLCNECAIPQDENHTFTCVLSSLNLAKWDEFEEDTIYWATVFLDCVASEMLADPNINRPELANAKRFTEKARALGLGVMGLATYFQKKMIPFESLHAHILNNSIFKKIQEESYRASRDLAKLFGEPEWCKGTGMRNATTQAIAPTLSSSVLCGSVSQGIEPLVANAFNQLTAAGEMTRMNPVFMELAKAKGKYSEELMKDLAINWNGSVQHLDWLTEHEKKVFKTAYEMNQSTILRMASMRQRFIDQGQSLNLFFSADESEERVAEVHKEFLLDPYLKGLYYLRSERGVKASTGECEACQ